jgi:hypothetical protein
MRREEAVITTVSGQSNCQQVVVLPSDPGHLKQRKSHLWIFFKVCDAALIEVNL